MCRIFHITLVCLLLLSLQSQLPWAHRHESLSPPELADHLQRFHAGMPATDIPQGWHVHRSPVEMIDPVCERLEPIDILGVSAKRIGILLTNCPAIVEAGSLEQSLVRRQHAARSTRTPLFQVYQSLLI